MLGDRPQAGLGLADAPERELHVLEVELDAALERRRADEALRVSEEKFSKAFRSSPLTLSLSRLSDGRIIEINDSASVMFGFSRDEVIGRTSLEVDIWVDARDRQELTAELEAKGFIRDKEYRFRRKDGAIITVFFGAEIIELEQERCMLATMVDITERKRVENALLESQERFQELAELLPETIFEMDADGVLTFVNQNAFAHLPCFTLITQL